MNQIDKIFQMKKMTVIAFATVLMASCSTSEEEPDATGTFEAVETIVSAEANGVIKEFKVQEGQVLSDQQVLGYIDTTQLHLKKKQLKAQLISTQSQRPDVSRQIASLEAQIKAAEREQTRIKNLLKADAATPKQMDDATSQIEVLKSQLSALQSSLSITSKGITLQADPLTIEIDQVDDLIARSIIRNPARGTVLIKYAEVNEMAVIGKALYKIADLSSLILRAYVTGDQLPSIKIGQELRVTTDAAKGKHNEYDGVIEWINDKAEFTPKTIQTKDERANLVYAVKIRVKNDGFLKLGMYGEIKLK